MIIVLLYVPFKKGYFGTDKDESLAMTARLASSVIISILLEASQAKTVATHAKDKIDEVYLFDLLT